MLIVIASTLWSLCGPARVWATHTFFIAKTASAEILSLNARKTMASTVFLMGLSGSLVALLDTN